MSACQSNLNEAAPTVGPFWQLSQDSPSRPSCTEKNKGSLVKVVLGGGKREELKKEGGRDGESRERERGISGVEQLGKVTYLGQ